MIVPEEYDFNRLPLGNAEFVDIREKNKVYVDKTDLIYKIARYDTPVFLSRPRRFGKSLLINTLSSLFTNGTEYFHGLKIEKMWHDKTYHVVHLDFSRFASKAVEKFKSELGDKLIREFSFVSPTSRTNSSETRDPDSIFDEIVQKMPNNKVVLLIDEYDAPLTHFIDKPDELQERINVLNDFYAVVKQYAGKFRFIFIAGVTRASHVSIFSAFNNLKDLSLRKEFNTLLGFTQNDLMEYLDRDIEKASYVLDLPKSDIYNRLEKYYNGFQFAFDAEETLYNPWSILSFLDSPEEGFRNYWFDSGGNSSLIIRYLKINNSFNVFNYNDKERIVTEKEVSSRYDITNIPNEILLFQTGYLTIRKKTSQTAFLIFPNTEVEDSILNLYLRVNNISHSLESQYKIDEISCNIDKRNLNEIVDTFNMILNDCVSILGNIFDDERSVRDIIYAALPQNISLQKIKERETTKGRSDLELLTRNTYMIIEFKRTNPRRDAARSFQEAVEQIEKKRYGIGLFPNHSLYRVAMVISSENRLILRDFCREI